MTLEKLISNNARLKDSYKPQAKLYKRWCLERNVPEGIGSALDYLYQTLEKDRLKKSSWELRLQAIKSYMSTEYGMDVNSSDFFVNAVASMRAEFWVAGREQQRKLGGAVSGDKEKILNDIEKLSQRAKAICLVNIDTANRPSDMVRLKVGDFDLSKGTVLVYLKKEKRHQLKNLTLKTVNELENYFKLYDLSPSSYLVGHLNRGGKLSDKQVSEGGYAKAIKKWLGITCSTLRKTQISYMFEAGANLQIISKQTGVSDLSTLVKHHLNISDSQIKRYL